MRVLVIEDNLRLSSLMVKLLRDNGHAVDAAHDLEEAASALPIGDYEVILLDLSLPDGDGRQILNSIRQRGDNALVLVVTARDDIVDRVQTLNSGADDYIVKPFSDDELIARVHALGRRSGPLREAILSAGNVRLDTRSMTLAIADKPVIISRRELLVLAALLAHAGRVVPREKLDLAVYSLDDTVTDNAMEAAVSRLRRHLDEAGATIKITAMRGIGYILTENATC